MQDEKKYIVVYTGAGRPRLCDSLVNEGDFIFTEKQALDRVGDRPQIYEIFEVTSRKVENVRRIV